MLPMQEQRRKGARCPEPQLEAPTLHIIHSNLTKPSLLHLPGQDHST